MAKKNIHLLIEKYLNNTISLEDLEILNKLLEDDKNVEIFKASVKDDYQLKTKEINFNVEKSFKRIESGLQILETKKRVQLKNFYKYAAAACVLIMVALSVYLFTQKENSEFKDPTLNPAFVNTEIEPGTDKATLTLEDGSVVVLEKGKSLQTRNATSNGEQIVYNQKQNARQQKPKAVNYNYLTIPRGGQYHLVLTDGTEVWLNSESKLKYPVQFVEGEHREVELVYGEAYFDVSPSELHAGSKFKVLNRFQKIEVLGTEFNIKAYKNDTNIFTTLVEGKVEVDNGAVKQLLKPSQQANFNLVSNNISVNDVNVFNEVSWRDGIFSFKQKPLKEIAKVLSRWYDVDIIFVNKELESAEFMGVIKKHLGIEEVFSIMKSSTIKSYEINGRTIILK